MMHWRRYVATAAIVAGLIAGLGVRAVNANPFNVNLVGNPSPLANGTFLFNYELVLVGQTEQFTNGSYFTVYDFAGLVSGSAPAGWTFSSALTGQTPASQAITESPVVPNLTFTYNGATPLADNTFSGFSAVSTMGGVQPGKFSLRGFDADSTPGPFEGNGVAGVPVPEPGTLGLLAIGFAGATFAGARRKK